MKGKPVDLVTLTGPFKGKGCAAGGMQPGFCPDIMDTVPTSANVRSYAQIVHDKAVLRRLIKINEGIANDCYAGKESLETILADTEKQIFALLQSRMSDGFCADPAGCLNVLDKIEQCDPFPVGGDRTGDRLRGSGLPHLGASAVGSDPDRGPAFDGKDGLCIEYRGLYFGTGVRKPV